jgi:hypothetical protein
VAVFGKGGAIDREIVFTVDYLGVGRHTGVYTFEGLFQSTFIAYWDNILAMAILVNC